MVSAATLILLTAATLAFGVHSHSTAANPTKGNPVKPTADSIEREVSRLPHANVTAVPFHFDTLRPGAPQEAELVAALSGVGPVGADGNGHGAATGAGTRAVDTPESVTGCVPIGEVRYRQHVRIEGRIRSMRVQPRAEVATLECVLVDDSGAISIVFLGRRAVAGIDVGVRLRVEGTAGESRGRLALLNPIYELVGRENGTMSHG